MAFSSRLKARQLNRATLPIHNKLTLKTILKLNQRASFMANKATKFPRTLALQANNIKAVETICSKMAILGHGWNIPVANLNPILYRSVQELHVLNSVLSARIRRKAEIFCCCLLVGVSLMGNDDGSSRRKTTVSFGFVGSWGQAWWAWGLSVTDSLWLTCLHPKRHRKASIAWPEGRRPLESDSFRLLASKIFKFISFRVASLECSLGVNRSQATFDARRRAAEVLPAACKSQKNFDFV